jgi:peptidyl-prolyl cis-trans isomerase SurA
MKKERFAARIGADTAAIAAAALLLNVTGCASVRSKLPWASAQQPQVAATPAPAAAAAASPPPSATPAPDQDTYGETVDKVIASVDGDPITLHDVDTTTHDAGGLSATTPPGSAPPTNPEEILKALIEQKLVEDESQRYAEKVDDADVDRFIQGIEEHDHLTDEQLRAQIQAQGMNYDEFRRQIRKQVQSVTMIDQEVRQKIVILDSEIKDYYKDHQDEFTVTDEKYRLAQILIAVPDDAKPEQVNAAQQKAEDLYKKAAKGADFGELARQYSDDDSKSKGGELGNFSPKELNDQIAAAVKSLKAGDITQVVRTKYGFHIVKVEEHRVPGTAPFEEVKRSIREKLANEQAKYAVQKWIDEDLAKQHSIETIN